MKQMVDIHVVLATPADMEFWEERAAEASDKLNEFLHYLYNSVDEDIDTHQLELMLQHIWENWYEDQYLLDIEEHELHDWVDQLLATWDDEPPEAHTDH
ncbi:hypothetical protein [Lacimicrobium alkaliphilum]|uniref:Fe-S assembly protein IscX n=1 Tax=Lacimicrobium alkaliphilum TaxID=1526571 RepID=A0ABQ1QYX0_9ALTE|nr:hypothetical protein [Lacimicrobium alkaliphilum]GGD52321.1 hypothetical protein GCM10011357_05250 [Lacimicrobium alkaliphilum]